jgi:hypothetical protein
VILRNLAVAEVPALAQQGIHQRRLPMIDVGNDRDVPDIVSHQIHSIPSSNRLTALTEPLFRRPA